MKIETDWCDEDEHKCALPQFDESSIFQLLKAWGVPDWLLKKMIFRFIIVPNMIMIDGMTIRRQWWLYEIYLPEASYQNDPGLLNLIVIHELRHARNAMLSLGRTDTKAALYAYGTEDDCRKAENLFRGIKLIHSYQICFEFMTDILKQRLDKMLDKK